MNIPCRRAVLPLLALSLLLQGCATSLFEPALQIYDSMRRSALREGALANNHEAQYELGNTYCCTGGGPLNGLTVYDNQQASHWYCLAAHQGNGQSQLRLAHLYSGHPIPGIHLAMRASAMLGSIEADRAEALMWAQVAADSGVNKAAEYREELLAASSAEERARAEVLARDWHTAPCEWSEVFPQAAGVQAGQKAAAA